MKKKGLSTVITSLLIILLVLIAIGILWVVIKNLITDISEDISLDKFTVSIGFVDFEFLDSNSIGLTLQRNPGGGEILGMMFVLLNGTNSEKIENSTKIAELQKTTYVLTPVMNTSSIEEILIVPIFESGPGEVVGSCEIINGVCVDNYDSLSPGGGSNPPSENPPAGIPPPEESCGDGSCTAGETCSSCLADCACTGSTPYCSSGTCVGCTLSSHCNDYNFCTTDSCVSGSCQNTPLNCDDSDICTDDSCVDGICQNAFNIDNCDDDFEVCTGADYSFTVSMYVCGENCLSPSVCPSVMAKSINVGVGGLYKAYGKVSRGDPAGLDCQSDENFNLQINGVLGLVSVDDLDPCAVSARTDYLGSFNFNTGSNNVIMNTAAPSCSYIGEFKNSVYLDKICLYS